VQEETQMNTIKLFQREALLDKQLLKPIKGQHLSLS